MINNIMNITEIVEFGLAINSFVKTISVYDDMLEIFVYDFEIELEYTDDKHLKVYRYNCSFDEENAIDEIIGLLSINKNIHTYSGENFVGLISTIDDNDVSLYNTLIELGFEPIVNKIYGSF